MCNRVRNRGVGFHFLFPARFNRDVVEYIERLDKGNDFPSDYMFVEQLPDAILILPPVHALGIT